MRKKSLVLLLFPLLFAACQSPPRKAAESTPAIRAMKPHAPASIQFRREQLVGSWYGDQPTKTGGRRQWVMHRSEDGTFRVVFRVRDRIEGNTDQTEVGIWGVNASYLVTLTRGWVRPGGEVEEAPSADSYFWDVYDVLAISGDALVYKSVETGNEYRTKKVSNDFQIPE